ncbi:hypothetical protein [Virgisporangium aurantiacum]|uniref:Uncharacterized protein n=1 Tax=Virgisporangium aurantiacum TaxID=175570 RepID=A0A8J3Z9B9_9ACTN|nr:hypothetical protein [Virgisporangium aurantiacum]GIJ57320.1 hypothetical protein Vau01_048360 [Virgisporangium aurantiacum]
MLLLGSANTVTIDGITCFPDDADRSQYWYLPAPVQLARDRNGRPRLTLIQYVGAADNALDDGGFLVFEVDCKLERDVERRLRTRLRAIAGGDVRLSPVQFDEGTVRCMAFDLDGPGGTVAPDGTFRVVEKISGSTTPSLGGDNNAIFTLKLSKEGAIIIRETLAQGGQVPVGALYDLKYTGLRPALDVTITADMSQVFTQFSASLEAQIYYVRAGIDAGFEKLVKDGAIKIVVKNFSTAEDRAEKEKWALDFFKENLLARYFDPVLTPGKLAGTPASAAPLNDVVALGQKLKPPQPPAPPKPPAGAGAPPAARPPSTTPQPGEPDHDSGATPAPGLAVPPEVPATADQAPSVGTGVGGGNPQVPAAGETGLGFDPAPIANIGSIANQISPVSFKLKFIRQEERRTLTFEYNRAEAVQMPYTAQGMLDVLTRDLDRAGMIVSVDLDDAFFRNFDVEVAKRIDFDRIGLNSAQIVLDYGDPSDPRHHKHADLLFTRSDPVPTARSWTVAMANIQATDYRRQVEYNFDPQSDWEGDRFEVDLPPELTDDRRYEINPYEHLNFLEIEVRPDPLLDWGIVEEITATITVEGAGATAPRRTMRFRAGDPPRRWRVRTPVRRGADGTRIAQRYDTELRYRLVGGGERTVISAVPVSGDVLNLPNPFAGTLVLEIRPMLPAGVQMAILDLLYVDGAYRRTVSLEFTPESGRQTRQHRIAIPDQTKRRYTYTITLITASTVTEKQPVETDNPRIFVS